MVQGRKSRTAVSPADPEHILRIKDCLHLVMNGTADKQKAIRQWLAPTIEAGLIRIACNVPKAFVPIETLGSACPEEIFIVL